VNLVVTSFCIVISLSASATYASEDKSRPLPLIPLRPLDVISTDDIALQTTDSTHIHPHKTTSCVIARTANTTSCIAGGKNKIPD
ncbi:hypothetical protein, partial [Sansalvadorimonas verongulae]|uniref:hypothetical protein n=1 Tax=Sansalvadorimonas verongulae TaxID=2172824 RepID=UPI001E459EBB